MGNCGPIEKQPGLLLLGTEIVSSLSCPVVVVSVYLRRCLN